MRHQLLITYEHTSTCDAEGVCGCILVFYGHSIWLYTCILWPFHLVQPNHSHREISPGPAPLPFFFWLGILELLASSSGRIM
jgi:hypothetical protein